MNKPKPRVRTPILDYNECRDYICEKYDCDIDDFANKFGGDKEGDFERYQRMTADVFPYPPGEYPSETKKGFKGWRQEDGKWVRCLLTKEEYDRDWRLIHEQYKRFLEWIKGNETPYQNFWHWVCEVKEVSRGGSVVFYDDDFEGSAPEDEWKKKIHGWFMEEFANGEDSLEMETDW